MHWGRVFQVPFSEEILTLAALAMLFGDCKAANSFRILFRSLLHGCTAEKEMRTPRNETLKAFRLVICHLASCLLYTTVFHLHLEALCFYWCVKHNGHLARAVAEAAAVSMRDRAVPQ